MNERGLEIDAEQFATIYRVYRANQRCYRAYAPPLLSRTIDVSLYRATQRRHGSPSLPHDYGWDRLLPNPVRATDVDADHLSILKRAPILDAGRPFPPHTDFTADVSEVVQTA